MKLYKDVNIYTTDHVFRFGDVVIENDRIAEVNVKGAEKEGALYLIPGLIDIHFHGAVGTDISDASVEGIHKMASYLAQRGVLAMCPATMTIPMEQLDGVMDSVRGYLTEAKEQEADLIGIHMEGPFLSPKKAGAQNKKALRPIDYTQFQPFYERNKEFIRMVDVAPELEGALEFIEVLHHKVKISLAHTACDYEQAVKAFEAGASHVTHLFHAMEGMHHRMPGLIPAAMEHNCEVELICDGIHVHPAMIRWVFRCFAPDKIILVSDSMRACGLTDGQYLLGDLEVEVVGNRATLVNDKDTIAGSVTNLYDCMRNAVVYGVRKELAILAATENPARSLGIEADYGRIAKGCLANCVLMNEDMEIVEVLNRGIIC